MVFILAAATCALAAGDGCGCCSTGGQSCCAAKTSATPSPVFALPHHPDGTGCACDTEPARAEPSANAAFSRSHLPTQLLTAPGPASTAFYDAFRVSEPPSPLFTPPVTHATFILKCSFVC